MIEHIPRDSVYGIGFDHLKGIHMSWREGGLEYLFQTRTSILRAAERVYTGIAYRPNHPGFRANPYPFYHRLQTQDPFHRTFVEGGWMLSRYEAIDTVLHDPRFSADDRNWKGWPWVYRIMRWAGRLEPGEPYLPSMLRSDPPDHARLRKLVSKAFTPRAIAALQKRIEQIVETHLDAVMPAGRMDVIGDLANPLPVIVIADMLGIPHRDREQFKQWSDEAVRDFDFISIEDFRRAGEAFRALRAYLFNAIEARRREPRDDILSALIMAEEDGEQLDTEEIYGTCALLLVAGNETTTNLIGNGLLALLRHPEQLEWLRETPEAMPQAIEELLRYDSPVQITSRFALDTLDIAGHQVQKGDQLLLLLGAANRDPDVFADPDRLDITRTNVRHLAFGQGIHFCLGAALARLQGQIALSALLRRCPYLTLATDTPVWRYGVTLRGLTSLPVTFTPEKWVA